ncbi:MAG: hydroxymethylbilane synthase [Balneola sp.]|nr:hydroxymethylbilane synthase [Balneola sp.]|tara:strand:- start:6096 stop:6983 length:888 start_codon:yes stop_codon:yes gene_type:complete
MLKIGTRRSGLALWQANYVQQLLKNSGYASEIIEIESFGDKILDIPIHKLGDKGVFTKALDIALLNEDIDLAVHSLKDVPTELEENLSLASVPTRENPLDVLVRPLKRQNSKKNIIATGSVRRKAFWLNKYPNYKITGLRGNVQTRIIKVDNNYWTGGIFAFAGLKRLGLSNRISEMLDWMLPAPAQGALGIVCRSNDEKNLAIFRTLEDKFIRKCVDTERLFLNTLGSGCFSPVGALTTYKDGVFSFNGAILSKDGAEKLEIHENLLKDKYNLEWGKNLAKKLIKDGAFKLLER